MSRKHKYVRPKPVYIKRILGETNARENSCKSIGWYQCKLNLSEVLSSLPMTINQEDIQIEATFTRGNLNLLVYCKELIIPENPSGGVYVMEEEEPVR